MIKLPRRYAFGLSLLALQLLGVAFFGLDISEKVPKSWLEPLNNRLFLFYGSLSGINNKYGFFAPDVSAPLRARFEYYDKDGRAYKASLQVGNPEIDIRIGNIIGAFGKGGEKSEPNKFNRSLAASCAGKIFALHPEARSVAVFIEYFDLPPIEKFAAGEAAQWVTYYTAAFTRAKTPS